MKLLNSAFAVLSLSAQSSGFAPGLRLSSTLSNNVVKDSKSSSVLVYGAEETPFDEEYPAMIKNFSEKSSLSVMVSLGINFSGLPSTAKTPELQVHNSSAIALVVEPPPSTQGQPPVPVGVEFAIRSVSSGNYLDGRDKNPDNNEAFLTNRDPQGDKFLHWIIEEVDGNYALKSRSSGFYLDGRNRSYAGKTGAVLMTDRTPKGDAYLQWTIEKVDGNFALRSVSSGLYLDGRNPLHLGNEILLTDRPPQGDANLQWTFFFSPQLPIGEDIAIRSVSSGNYLDGRDKHPDNNEAFLTDRDPKGDKFLHWIIEEVDGNYALKSRSSGFYLDGRNRSYAGKTGAVLVTDRTPKGDAYLQWTIEKVDGNFALRSVTSGLYLDGRNPVHLGNEILLTDRPPRGDKYLQWTFIAQ